MTDWKVRLKEYIRLSHDPLNLGRQFEESVSVADNIAKHFKKSKVLGIRISHMLLKAIPIVIVQGIRVAATRIGEKLAEILLAETLALNDLLVKLAGKSQEQGVRVSTEAIRHFGQVIAQPLFLAYEMTKGLARQIQQGVEILDTVSARTTAILLQLVQGFRLIASFVELEVPSIQVEWLGSFPRPSRASMTIHLERADDGTPLTGATVTANIYRADTGALFKSVTFTETSTPSVYRGTFTVQRKDPVGTYSVRITAVRGVNSIVQTGYIIVYVGAPLGIRYH